MGTVSNGGDELSARDNAVRVRECASASDADASRRRARCVTAVRSRHYTGMVLAAVMLLAIGLGIGLAMRGTCNVYNADCSHHASGSGCEDATDTAGYLDNSTSRPISVPEAPLSSAGDEMCATLFLWIGSGPVECYIGEWYRCDGVYGEGSYALKFYDRVLRDCPSEQGCDLTACFVHRSQTLFEADMFDMYDHVPDYCEGKAGKRFYARTNDSQVRNWDELSALSSAYIEGNYIYLDDICKQVQNRLDKRGTGRESMDLYGVIG